jgi:hypothetical protein
MGILIVLVAFILVLVLFGGPAWSRIWSIQRARWRPRLHRYNPKNVWRRARKKPTFEVDMPTIRDFILTLQLSLSLAETMAGALTQASKQFGSRGQFGQRLMVRVRSQLQVEPEAVIRALSVDFSSEHLEELAERLEMAHEGGFSYRQAVDASLDDVEEEIRVNVEKEIERAPVVLTIPMIIGVFFSALALLGYPLLQVMATNLAATQGGG